MGDCKRFECAHPCKREIDACQKGKHLRLRIASQIICAFEPCAREPGITFYSIIGIFINNSQVNFKLLNP